MPPGVPPYNFASIPRIASRDPLWEQPELARDIAQGAYFLGDASSGRRETLGTSAIDAEPEQVICLSKSSWWPLIAAIATGIVFVGLLSKVYLLIPFGAALTAAAFLAWAWTTGEPRAPERIDAGDGLVLPSQRASRHGPGWSAMVNTLLVDGAASAALLFAYFYLWAHQWSAAPLPPVRVGFLQPLVALALLAVSSIAIQWGLRANARAEPRRFRIAWIVAIALGLAFGALHVREWTAGIALDPRASAYGSVVYAFIAFHLLHVLIALLMAGYCIARSLRGYLDARRPLEARVTALFWHYSVAVWVVSFAVIYFFPVLI